MVDFAIKQNDTRPKFEVRLLDGFKQPLNLTGATVLLHMRLKPGGAVKITGGVMGAVGNAVDGRQSYTFTAANTDTAGTYEAEVQVTFSDGGIRTIPPGTYMEFLVKDDVA